MKLLHAFLDCVIYTTIALLLVVCFCAYSQAGAFTKITCAASHDGAFGEKICVIYNTLN